MLLQPPRSVRGPSRRAALIGAVLVGVAACSDSPAAPPTGKAPAGAPEDPDRPTVDTVRAEKVSVLRDYDAALAGRPELAKELGPLRATHAAHLEALGPQPGQASPSPSPAGTQARATVLRRLAATESSAAARRVLQCRELRSGALARLVAAIGGAEAAHASLLRDLAGDVSERSERTKQAEQRFANGADEGGPVSGANQGAQR